MGTEALVRGFLIGGGLGAALAYLTSDQCEAGADEEAAPVSLEAYPHITADANLQSILPELVRLYSVIDPEATQALLCGLEELAAVYATCRAEASPALFAQALQARRKATAALARLSRAARQSRPMAASEASEDLQALQKHIADCVHNVDQEIGFQLASRA